MFASHSYTLKNRKWGVDKSKSVFNEGPKHEEWEETKEAGFMEEKMKVAENKGHKGKVMEIAATPMRTNARFIRKGKWWNIMGEI